MTQPAQKQIADRASWIESGRFTVRVPASTANLGPGFDALALALNLYCDLKFELLKDNDRAVPLITLKGALLDGLPKDQNNLIYTVLKNQWKNDPEILQRVRITVQSEIPLGKGLGSSAAAIMGAVWAAGVMSGGAQDPTSLLLHATELEGHSDNVAAGLLGGLVISGRSNSRRGIVTQKLDWPEVWRPIVIVPQTVLSTKESRAALPKTIVHGDAVSNVQKVALFIAAVCNKDEDALRESMHDRLHEPYRASLVPHLAAIRKTVSDLPVIGCVLSGAGPSVLVLTHQRHRAQVLECLNGWALRQQQPAQVLDLSVDQEGLRVFE